MSDDEDDFDLDFVSNASRKVQSKWSKTALTKSPKKPKEKQEEEQRSTVAVTPCSPVRGLGAGSRVAVTASPGSDSEVSLTPPASPSGTTPSPAPTPKGRARAVRGANRTNKTKKALAKLKKAVPGEGATRAKMSRREMSMDGSLLVVEEGGAVSSGGEEESMEVKVRWRTKVVRVTAVREEQAGQLIDRLAAMFSLPRGGVILYRGPESTEGIDREEILGELGITVATVLQARPRVVVEGDKDEFIELRLQTKDRRSPPVVLKLRSTDKMALVVEQYVEKTGVARDKLKFFFDGEELDEDETAEDMEMEGGECIDVHVSS